MICIAFLIAFECRGIGTDDRNKLGVYSDAGVAPEKSTDTEVA